MKYCTLCGKEMKKAKFISCRDARIRLCAVDSIHIDDQGNHKTPYRISIYMHTGLTHIYSYADESQRDAESEMLSAAMFGEQHHD